MISEVAKHGVVWTARETDVAGIHTFQPIWIFDTIDRHHSMAIGIFLIHSYFGMAIGIPIDLILSQSIPSTDHLQVVQKQQSQGRVGEVREKD